MAGWPRAIVAVCVSWASASALSASTLNQLASSEVEPQDTGRLEQVAIKVAKDVKVLREIVKIHGGRIQGEADSMQKPFSDRLPLSMPSLPSTWTVQFDALARQQPQAPKGDQVQPSHLLEATVPLTLPATRLHALDVAVPQSDNSQEQTPEESAFTLGGAVPIWLGILIEVVVLIVFIVCICGIFFFLCGQMFNRKGVEMVDNDPELHELWLKWEPSRAQRNTRKQHPPPHKQVCPTCRGSGMLGHRDCTECHGTGHINVSKNEDLKQKHQKQKRSHTKILGMVMVCERVHFLHWTQFVRSEKRLREQRASVAAEPRKEQLWAMRKGLKVKMFQHLPDEDHPNLANALEKKNFPRGARLCSQGDDYGSFWIIASGEAIAIVDNQRVTTLRKGNAVGDVSLMRKMPQPATIIADTDLTTYLLTEDRFQDSGLEAKLERIHADEMVTSMKFGYTNDLLFAISEP